MLYQPKSRLGVKLNSKHPLSRGLVGCWIFNEKTGDTVFDVSGHGNVGVINGADWVPDGLNFVRASIDYINIGSPPELIINGEMSISGMFSANSDYINTQVLVGCSIATTGNTAYALTFGFTNNKLEFWNSASGPDITSTKSISDNNLYHYVITRKGSTSNWSFKIYIDGVLDNSDSATRNPTGVSTSSVSIGKYGAYNGLSANVLMQNVMIHDRVLSPSEVAQLHRKPYAMFQQPISPQLYIFFDESIIISIEALAGAGLLDNVALTQKHTLAVQDISGTGAIDNAVLTQKHLLAVQELLSSGILDAVALTQKHLLAVQELSGIGTLDNVGLTQKNILIIQELLSAGALDNIELSISILLVVADLLSNGALDNTDLVQKHTLIIQELDSAGALDSIDLTQKHLLIVQSLLSAGVLDNIELLLATLLIVANMISTGTIDNVDPTQKHILSVDEVLSAGQLDGAVLTQKNLLAINDLISSGVIDNIQFDIATGLICITLTQATEYNISLTQGTEYNIILTQTGGGVC